MARKAAERMLEGKTEVIIVSLSEDQAKLIIMMITRYLEQEHKLNINKKKSQTNSSRIGLKNGSFALARPVGNTGDALRGFTGDILIIDEASRMPELAFIAAEPTLLSTGGEVWMCSTPHGKSGYFWDQYNAAVQEEDSEIENEMGWKVMHVDGEQAILNRPTSESWTAEKREKAIRRLNKLKERWSDLRYGQEILAQFMDDLMRFYTEETVEKCCIGKKPEQIPQNDNYMGNDLARMGGDSFTVEILHRESNGHVRQLETFSKKLLTTVENEDLIMSYAREYNCTQVGIDAGSGTLGVSILDHLLNVPDMERKMVPMNNRKVIIDRDNTTQSLFNEDMHDNLRSMMESGKITLLNDEKVKMSLRSVQIELKQDSHGLTKVRIYGNDTHIVEGLIRAAYLANQKGLNLQIHTI